MSLTLLLKQFHQEDLKSMTLNSSVHPRLKEGLGMLLKI